MKKALALMAALMVMIGALAACGEDAKDISLYDLNRAMSDAGGEFQDMKYASSADENPEDLFEHISDMDYGKVKAFAIYYAANGTGNADEIAIIQVKKKADLNEAELSLKAHLAKRKDLYKTYDDSQLPKLDKARIVKKDSVAALIVADNASDIEDAFFNFLAHAE